MTNGTQSPHDLGACFNSRQPIVYNTLHHKKNGSYLISPLFFFRKYRGGEFLFQTLYFIIIIINCKNLKKKFHKRVGFVEYFKLDFWFKMILSLLLLLLLFSFWSCKYPTHQKKKERKKERKKRKKYFLIIKKLKIFLFFNFINFLLKILFVMVFLNTSNFIFSFQYLMDY
jgi:Na+/melibiose symporter-like transporter